MLSSLYNYILMDGENLMFKKLFITIFVILLLLAIIIQLRPNNFKISRSLSMKATPEAIFPHVNDLSKWNAWSPWAKLDPNAKNSFEGPTSGNGAIMRWAGNNDVGEGSMTIVDSRPSELVKFRLDFLKPFAGTNMAEFSFKNEGNQTLVNWSMSGENNFITKAIGLVINCDKMVGEQFEKGLVSLKTIVEAN